MEQNKRIDHFHICNSIWERSTKKSEISYSCTIELYIIFKLFPPKNENCINREIKSMR